MNPTKEIRTLAAVLQEVEGVDRIAVLDDLDALTQRIRDDELLELTKTRGAQSALARKLGISREAVSARVENARKRRDAR